MWKNKKLYKVDYNENLYIQTPFFSYLPIVENLTFEYSFYSLMGRPILFTCKDKENKYYMCYCYKNFPIEKWIVSQVNSFMLRGMFTKKQPSSLALIFKSGNIKFDITLDETNDTVKYSVKLVDSFDEDLLPNGHINDYKFNRYIDYQEFIGKL